MVDSVTATVDAIVAAGGEIVQPIGADAPGDPDPVPRSRRKRDRPLPAAGLMLPLQRNQDFWSSPRPQT